MTLYSCGVGTSWTLIDAANADAAREQLGIRLGYEHKPWLWRGISVRVATSDDVERYGAHVDTAKNQGASPARRPHTEALRKKLPPEPA